MAEKTGQMRQKWRTERFELWVDSLSLLDLDTKGLGARNAGGLFEAENGSYKKPARKQGPQSYKQHRTEFCQKPD